MQAEVSVGRPQEPVEVDVTNNCDRRRIVSARPGQPDDERLVRPLVAFDWMLFEDDMDARQRTAGEALDHVSLMGPTHEFEVDR